MTAQLQDASPTTGKGLDLPAAEKQGTPNTLFDGQRP
jgi:hypothetical protein